MVVIPAFINLSIILYIVFVMPRTRLAKVFLLFNIGLLCWQITDLFGRLSADAATANFWDRMLCLGWIMVGSLSLHFALLYSNNKQILRSYLIVGLLYAPSIILAVLYILWVDARFYTFHTFWGYVNPQNHNIFFLIIVNWVSILVLVALGLMIFNTLRSKSNGIKFYQSLFITIGFAIPVIQGIITQVILPNTIGIAIPVTSTFMIFLSIATLVALNRYQLFGLEDAVEPGELLDLLPEIVFTTGPSGTLSYANAHAQRLFTLSENKIEEVALHSLFRGHDELYEMFKERVVSAVSKGETVINEPCRFVNIDGSIVFTLASAEKLSQSKRIPGMVVIARDITQLKESEQALEKQQHVLKKTNAELEKFLYSTSHDLRAPLTTIMGLISLAKKEQDHSKFPQYLGMMDTTINKLDDYIQGVIAFSQNNSLPIKLEEFALEEDLDIVMQRLSIKLGKIPVEMKFEYPPGTKLFADRMRLREILFQLLLNAIMYRKNSGGNSLVTIQYTQTKHHYQFQISDNGTGMEREMLKRAFDMFYRGSDKAIGSGLGLYITREIVHKLGGSIIIDSLPDRGTTVTVDLPINGNSMQS